jgi:endonuclease/exonuclease/phosphatase family metal-dependent hydrolase
MRILSYNILDGGRGREELLAAVIQAQRPDIVGLVEAEDRDVVEKLAGGMNMDFIHAPGNKRASAVLSRFPFRQTINHGPLYKEISHSFVEATVLDAGGVEWTLGVLHLNAHATEHDEQIREREIEPILAIFQRYRAAHRPHLLMGDFNSNAPYQVIDPERCKPSTRKEWQANGGHIPRRVIQRVLNEGYVDSLRAVDPTASETLGTFSTEFPGQRVDYIFTFGFETNRFRTASIIYDSPARQASDHFPVILEVEP